MVVRTGIGAASPLNQAVTAAFMQPDPQLAFIDLQRRQGLFGAAPGVTPGFLPAAASVASQLGGLFSPSPAPATTDPGALAGGPGAPPATSPAPAAVPAATPVAPAGPVTPVTGPGSPAAMLAGTSGPGAFQTGGFVDRFLGAGRPGTLARGFQRGFFGAEAIERQRQMEEAQIRAQQALILQRQAEAAKDAAQAARPQTATFQRPDGSFMQIQATDRAAFDAAVADPNLTLVNQPTAQRPGTVVQFRNAETGEFTQAQLNTPEAQALVNDPNQVFTGAVSVQETGGPGSATLTRSQEGKAQSELNAQAAALNSYSARAQRLLDIIGTGGANTLTAQLANVGNRLRNEARTMAREFGVEFESGAGAFDPNRFQGAFEAAGLAGQSARVRNAFLGLAIQRAIASGLGTGRALSDRDIESQLRTLGQNQSDPEILRRILADDFANLRDTVTNQGRAFNLAVPEIDEPGFVVPPNVSDIDEQGRPVIDLRTR